MTGSLQKGFGSESVQTVNSQFEEGKQVYDLIVHGGLPGIRITTGVCNCLKGLVIISMWLCKYKAGPKNDSISTVLKVIY